jgi:hypothetical protein
MPRCHAATFTHDHEILKLKTAGERRGLSPPGQTRLARFVLSPLDIRPPVQGEKPHENCAVSHGEVLKRGYNQDASFSEAGTFEVRLLLGTFGFVADYDLRVPVGTGDSTALLNGSDSHGNA